MASLAKKIGMIAALALALAPGSSLWSAQGQAQAPKTDGKDSKPAPSQPAPGVVKKILNNADQMRTEGERHAAAVDAVQNAGNDKGVAGSTGSTGSKGATAAPKLTEPGTQRDKGDPFAVPIKPQVNVAQQVRPQGQAGLLVSEVELQGLVKSADSRRNIAVVRAPNGFTYFLKAGDKLFNARVVKVTEDAAYFEETVTDAMGKSTKNEVVKRLASAPPGAKRP